MPYKSSTQLYSSQGWFSVQRSSVTPRMLPWLQYEVGQGKQKQLRSMMKRKSRCRREETALQCSRWGTSDDHRCSISSISSVDTDKSVQETLGRGNWHLKLQALQNIGFHLQHLFLCAVIDCQKAKVVQSQRALLLVLRGYVQASRAVAGLTSLWWRESGWGNSREVHSISEG